MITTTNGGTVEIIDKIAARLPAEIYQHQRDCI